MYILLCCREAGGAGEGEAAAPEGGAEGGELTAPPGLRPEVGGSYDFGGEMGEGEDDDVVAVIPRYAMPNISSILPEYANCEQDVIRRAFANANYDALHNLPSTLDYGEVNKHRRAHMVGRCRLTSA